MDIAKQIVDRPNRNIFNEKAVDKLKVELIETNAGVTATEAKKVFVIVSKIWQDRGGM
ncbi:MAG: hypothetical protein JRN03_06130 [Nitrososphaerota archaeon]|jgi:hypothetical protein|nr:hypothetical protein [Nitrososphaerota archaeon]